MQLQLPATSIFGKEEGDNRPLHAFARFLVAQNPPASPEMMITPMKFDTKEKRFPRKETLYDLYSRSLNTVTTLNTLLAQDYPQYLEQEGDIASLHRAYDRYQREHNLMDYDDLLLNLAILLREHEAVRTTLGDRYKYVMVDEYQDTLSTFARHSVLLTGASAGIGRELALALAGEGARVALVARDAAALEGVAARCRALGTEAVALPGDVSDPDSCRDSVARTVGAFGGQELLLLNAGQDMWARLDELRDPSVLERLMRVNYLGAAWTGLHALPHLKAARGRLVVVSSLAGLTGVPTRTGYAASKHALHGFFDSLRIELAGTGVSTPPSSSSRSRISNTCSIGRRPPTTCGATTAAARSCRRF